MDKNEARLRGLRSTRGHPGIARARVALNREPRTPTREGLKKTLGWFAQPSERIREVC